MLSGATRENVKMFYFSWLLYKRETEEQIVLCGVPERGFEKCRLLGGVQENPHSSRRPAAPRPPRVSCCVTVVLLSQRRSVSSMAATCVFVPVNGEKNVGDGKVLVLYHCARLSSTLLVRVESVG